VELDFIAKDHLKLVKRTSYLHEKTPTNTQDNWAKRNPEMMNKHKRLLKMSNIMSTLDKDNKKSIRKFNKIWKRDLSPTKLEDDTMR